MARRIRAREVLRLRSVNGLSQNAIARTAHVSKHSVQDVLEAARERGVSWEDVEGMSEEAAYALLFPGRGDAGPVHADPDWARGLGRRDLRDSGASRRGVHRHGGPPRRRRPEGRGAQRRAVRQARGLEARGVRGGRAPAAEAPTGRALRGVRVGLRPQGPGQLPRRVRPQLLLGEPPARRLDGRPARHRGQGGGLLRRRARGHAPQVPVLREEPLLHARLGHARGQGVVGLGRAAHPRLGLEGRALLLRAGGQGVRLLRVRRAGLQRRARRAQAVQALHPGEARAGVRDGARDREEVAALPRRRARAEVGAGQGASRRGVRGLRLRARRRLLRGGVSMDVNAETARKLREMGAAELLAALSAQDEAVCAGMAFAERVQMAVDEAHSDFITQKVRNLTRRAGLRYPEADVRSVDFFEGRGLDRVAVAELATCGFVGRGENVVLQGLLALL